MLPDSLPSRPTRPCHLPLRERTPTRLHLRRARARPPLPLRTKHRQATNPRRRNLRRRSHSFQIWRDIVHRRSLRTHRTRTTPTTAIDNSPTVRPQDPPPRRRPRIRLNNTRLNHRLRAKGRILGSSKRTEIRSMDSRRRRRNRARPSSSTRTLIHPIRIPTTRTRTRVTRMPILRIITLTRTRRQRTLRRTRATLTAIRSRIRILTRMRTRTRTTRGDLLARARLSHNLPRRVGTRREEQPSRARLRRRLVLSMVAATRYPQREEAGREHGSPA